MAWVDKKTHRFYSQNEHGPQKSGLIGEKMEVEVKNAIQSLAHGNARLEPHQVLTLEQMLGEVDVKFSILRREISRLNADLADAKDANDALKESNRILSEKLDSLTKTSTKNTKPPKSKKKKTNTKKKLTTKKK